MPTYIHPTAEVSDRASLGEGTTIWHQAQIREGAQLGTGCIAGKGAYIGVNVTVGNYAKIQNYACLYQGATLADGVFVGPHACFTNDLRPRAINRDGSIKTAQDWSNQQTYVQQGAAIGANATILGGITIGKWAMIGAGSVVTKDVPNYGLVRGNPARLEGFVCSCGASLGLPSAPEERLQCPQCRQQFKATSNNIEATEKQNPSIPISQPLIDQEDKEAVLAVLDSGMLAQGQQTALLEEKFAEICGTTYAVATSSGTTALHLALLAHGIGPGDEVITTPFTFIATINSILFTGARPVFVDIEEDTFNLNPHQIKNAISARTKAILPVHLYGHPCEMKTILKIATEHNLIVIEDAAQAVGAQYHNRPTGSFGTGCFSLYATKNITSAEGGVITTDDPAIAEHCRLLRNHGSRRRYQHRMLGYNFRISDVHAALGVAQTRKLPTLASQRHQNAEYLNQNLTGAITPTTRTGCRHAWHQYTIRIEEGLERRNQIKQQLQEAGINTGIFYPTPAHQHAYLKKFGVNRYHLPIAERLANEVLSLPVHPKLSRLDLEKIVREVNRLC